MAGVVRRPPSGPAPRVAVHGSWLLPCADTRGDGPLSPAGDYRTAPADTRSDPVLRGGRGYPEPWTRDDERAFGTPLNPPEGCPANVGVVILARPKDVLLGTWWDRGETEGLSGALARFLASSRKRDKAERRCAVARVRGSRVEWTVHGSLAVAVNWPLNTAFRLVGRSGWSVRL